MDKAKRDQVRCESIWPGLFLLLQFTQKGVIGLDKEYAIFRKKHNCLECAYKMESHNCFKEGICLIDISVRISAMAVHTKGIPENVLAFV